MVVHQWGVRTGIVIALLALGAAACDGVVGAPPDGSAPVRPDAGAIARDDAMTARDAAVVARDDAAAANDDDAMTNDDAAMTNDDAMTSDDDAASTSDDASTADDAAELLDTGADPDSGADDPDSAFPDAANAFTDAASALPDAAPPRPDAAPDASSPDAAPARPDATAPDAAAPDASAPDASAPPDAGLPPYAVISRYGRQIVAYAVVQKNNGHERRMYIESAALAQMTATGPIPDGPLVFMEEVPGGTISRVFIRGKQGGAWQSNDFPPGSPNYTTTAQPNCEGCHGLSAGDFTWTLPLLHRLIRTHVATTIQCAQDGFNPCPQSTYEGPP